MTNDREVVGLNLTDVSPNGEQDPITDAILQIAVAAAKVVTSANDLTSARILFSALRSELSADLTGLRELVDSVERMLVVVTHELGSADG